ncbi:hypothetical protein GN956_G9570 [Arapaima gigas]
MREPRHGCGHQRDALKRICPPGGMAAPRLRCAHWDGTPETLSGVCGNVPRPLAFPLITVVLQMYCWLRAAGCSRQHNGPAGWVKKP